MESHQNSASLQSNADSMHIDNDDSSRLQNLQHHQQPSSSPIPNLPLFSTTLSDHTITNSSTLSSKSGSSVNHTTSEGSSNTSHDASRQRNNINNNSIRRKQQLAQDMHNRALSKKALQENDSLVYLDGPQVYTCGNCRTHLTSHDDIISKSFHGRHGRAYLFDQCVNITKGQPEDRMLITGLHSVSDIFCKRCKLLVGWTYDKAYETSQKYKEGKFIIEKINLHLEESDYYTVDRPAGERGDRFRARSMSWGSERSVSVGSYGEASTPSTSTLMGSSPTGSVGLYSKGRSGSHSSHHRSLPQTPPTRRSPAMAMMMSPKSPRSPSDIIYEYRQGDD